MFSAPPAPRFCIRAHISLKVNNQCPSEKAISKRFPVTRSTGKTKISTAKMRSIRRWCVFLFFAFVVRVIPDAVRSGRRIADDGSRRRRQEGLLEGNRSVLSVRCLLYDEVSLYAAAPLEPGFPALDAARESGQLPQRGRRIPRQVPVEYRCVGKVRRPPDRHASCQCYHFVFC